MGRRTRKKNRRVMRRAIRQLGKVAVGAIAEFAEGVLGDGMKRLSRNTKALRDKIAP